MADHEMEPDRNDLDDRQTENSLNVSETNNVIPPLADPIGGPFDDRWLLDYSQIPQCSRVMFIYRGYRPMKDSLIYCFGTIFSLHNETGNIWTHLIGVAIFAALGHNTKQLDIAPKMGYIDYALLYLFFLGIITCLSASALFHTLCCHSAEAIKLCSKLDYCGITVLIATSFIPWLYYGWFNSPNLRIFYFALATFFAIGCLIVSLCDRFGEPNYHPYRAALFLGDGLAGILPGIHWAISEIHKQGFSKFIKLNHQPGLLLAMMGATYTIGGLLYGLKLPEKYFPGRFDLWLNSHQIFHILVIVGGLLYYHSIIGIMKIRFDDPTYFYN